MISFVYFDVGGVVMHDTKGTTKWHEMVTNLGMVGEYEKKFNALYKTHAEAINEGALSTEAFIDLVRTAIPEIPIPTSYNMVDDLVNNYFGKNPSIWPVITEIQKTTRTGLLTNTYLHMLEAIENKGLLSSMQFDITINSAHIHMQKPDRDIYKYAQMKAGVPNEEILFIDNSEENLVEPKKLGWQTFYYDSTTLENSSKNLLKAFLQLRMVK